MRVFYIIRTNKETGEEVVVDCFFNEKMSFIKERFRIRPVCDKRFKYALVEQTQKGLIPIKEKE